MGFLANKRILITGMISTRSIAYGVAVAMHREGAQLAFTYQGERVRERVLGLAREFNSELVFECDVASDDDINNLFINLKQHWDGFDGFVHAIAFAPREALEAALPMMEGRNAAILTLSYLGAVRTMPHYNVMGMAKASLEASVRYLAMQLGARGIRANGISAGPIRTLAAAGIADFGKLLGYNEKHAPLKRNVTADEVGNAAAFLCSDLASGITGEIPYVDGGFNTTSLGSTEA